jgi:hypothetical protein
LGQTKDYCIGICCFSAKHAALRRKSKDWLAQNQKNSTCIYISVTYLFKALNTMFITQNLIKIGKREFFLTNGCNLHLKLLWICLVIDVDYCPRTITLVCVASPLSTQHYGERAKTGWFRSRRIVHVYPRTVVSVS